MPYHDDTPNNAASPRSLTSALATLDVDTSMIYRSDTAARTRVCLPILRAPAYASWLDGAFGPGSVAVQPCCGHEAAKQHRNKTTGLMTDDGSCRVCRYDRVR